MSSYPITENPKLVQFGFSRGKGGAHNARTMMLDELVQLLNTAEDHNVPKEEYKRVIEEDNCLGKRSGKSRSLTYKHLVDLYTLDPTVALFRALLYFWDRDEQSRPLLALQCAFSRDAILRMGSKKILGLQEGTLLTREELETFIDENEPGRYSPATLKSVAQNINGTFTRSGHLVGRTKKNRAKANPSAGAIAYALYLGYLTGARGENLFRTDFMNLMDCSYERAIELAEDASHKGWIVFKRIGNIIEVLFPKQMTQQEMEWLHE